MRERQHTILVIREKVKRENLLSELKDSGFNVVGAENDKQVLFTLKKKKPTLIILDITSYEFGSAILDMIKVNDEFNIIPIIAILPSNNIKERVKWLEAGVNDCVDSSYDYQELLARINSQLKTYLQYTKIKDQNEILRATTVFDEITGLFNKRYLLSRIIGEISRATREGSALSFVVIEVDNYDYILSKFGSETKDYILKQIAFLTRKVARLSDIIIRYGERQVAILCPITERSGLDTFVERLRQMIETSTFEYNGFEIRTTVSMGAYTLGSGDFNSLEKKVSNIFAFAEEALGRAKLDGNKVVFFD